MIKQIELNFFINPTECLDNFIIKRVIIFTKGAKIMKAVITVVGEDKTGIIAKVSNLLYENNINILDISQTIMDGTI